MTIVFMMSFSTALTAEDEYKIISSNGTVKIKTNTKVIRLEKQLPFILKKDDAVMIYPNASIEVVLPNGNNKTISGPLYATVDTLENPPSKELLDFFAKPSQWKGIERIFEEEGQESSGTTRGTQEDSLNLYSDINNAMGEIKIEDKPLSPEKEKEMKKNLETAEKGFRAFPEEKRTVIRSMVYKAFGLDKTAMSNVLSFYKGILNKKEQQPQRELLEDYLFNQFLPIVVKIDRTVFPPLFTSNIKIWWVTFYFDGNQLKSLDNTLDYSTYPLATYKIKSIPSVKPNSSARGTAQGKKTYLFIVACADWTELEKLDDLKFAQKELLETRKSETQAKKIQDFGTVIIKIVL